MASLLKVSSPVTATTLGLAALNRMGKRNRKVEPLHPCSNKRGELDIDGRKFVVNKEDHGEKGLDSTYKFSQPATDDLKIEDDQINLCGTPSSLSHSHTCGSDVDPQKNLKFKQLCKEKRKDVAASQLTHVPPVRRRVIFILENVSLNLGFVRKKRKILCSHDDSVFLQKKGKNPTDYRPDIFYESLRGILDSPLNKADMVGAIYVKTDSGVTIEVKPQTRIPRTYKRFSGIMVELLEKSCVRAKDSGEVLLQVLKEPLARHMPENARIIGLSYSSEKLVDIEDYLSATPDDSNLVFVVGAMVHGKVSKDSTNDYVSVSRYPLATKCCVGLVCEALEQKYKLAHG